MRSDFDLAYVDDEIQQNREALDQIDDFMVQAHSTELKSLLQVHQRTVANRLRDARLLKTFLGT
jgi:hypothetical protein